jgi:hypothetical protein
MPELNLVEELREHAYHLARGEIVDVCGLEKVIREAAEIISQLDTTRDGVPITPRTELWGWADTFCRLPREVAYPTEWYSTEQAARSAAAEGKQDVDQ